MTPKDGDITIVPKVKFRGTLTISKYKKHEHTNLCDNNCTIKDSLIQIDGKDSFQYDFELGEAGIEDKKTEIYTELKIEPGNYYVLDYKLELPQHDEIDRFADKFDLIFNSDIEAKITQENNPGWEEDGTQ